MLSQEIEKKMSYITFFFFFCFEETETDDEKVFAEAPIRMEAEALRTAREDHKAAGRAYVLELVSFGSRRFELSFRQRWSIFSSSREKSE